MPADSTIVRHRARIVTRDDLLSLAKFLDVGNRAISFYFSLVSTPDNSHREEAIAIKRLIREARSHFAFRSLPASLVKDLDDILTAVEEVRLNPARLRAVFACREKQVWWEFDLPVSRSISQLQVGCRFLLVPLMALAQSCVPYCVAVLESGKARLFVVRGREIEEVVGRLPEEDLSLHAQDSRVGWSSHVDREVAAHEKAYFKTLSHMLHEFMAEQHIPHLVVGCREDLWGEIRPQFAPFLTGVFIGHFHLPNFAISSSDVPSISGPIFRESQVHRSLDLIREINESPSRAAIGVSDVLRALGEGRVLKLVLGRLPNQTISECRDCGRMWSEAGHNCTFCGSTKSSYMPADEGLIRQALLTGAEIVFVETDMVPGFTGAAGLLRY